MVKPAELAARDDFRVGPLEVSPARRRIAGPGGEAQLEPVVMQVLLLLLDAGGRVVTRDALFEAGWGGAIVGDDSLNRAMATVRKAGARVAPGLFEIETIPRTGYRLVGDLLGPGAAAPVPSGETRGIPRRTLVAGAAAAVAAGGLALWWIGQREEREFDELVAKGEETLGYGDPAADPAPFFQRAAALRPDDARALGLYAYARALRAEGGAPAEAAVAVQEAERATRAALDRDPADPNARLASIILNRSTLDFAATEERLRAVLATDPANTDAMRQLWNLLQCVGRSRDALVLVEQALRVAPLAAANHYPRAQLMWIIGRTAEADRVIDRAMQFWPAHRFVRFARFSIFAFTGRPRAALAMLERPETAPQNFSPASVALWRVSLPALDNGSPATVAAAVAANVDAAKDKLQLSAQAVMTLSVLGAVDAAFDILDGLFAINRTADRRGPAAAPPVTSTAWRFAPWLFTPPVAAVRADPRFATICDQIGLTDYWAKRGIRPDYQLRGT